MGRRFLSLELLIIGLFILSWSCSKIDKDKFSDLYRTVNEIESSITIGINYIDFTKLLQKLSAEKGLINLNHLNDEEKKLLDFFEKIYTVYFDSHTIWKLETEYTFKMYSNFPREYILYYDEPFRKNEILLKSLANKYDLEVEAIEFKSWSSATESGFNPTNRVSAINRNKAINKIWSTSSLIFLDIKKIYTQEE